MGRSLEFDKQQAAADAMELFWRRGFEATSIDDLTRHLGIGRASLYNTFGDKRGLLQAALELYDAASCAALASFLDRPGTAREVIEIMLAWQGQDARAEAHPRGCFFLAMASELCEEDAGVIACVQGGIARIEQTFAELLRRGRADGSIQRSVEVAETARLLTGTMIAVRALARAGGSAEIIAVMLESGRRALG
jgi:TetR/AcrR family transcriptional repressor of nem operon